MMAGTASACSTHLGRKLVRQMMLADDDLDIDAEIVRAAEDLDHAADGAAALLRKFEQLDIDDHAVQLFDRFDLGRR